MILNNVDETNSLTLTGRDYYAPWNIVGAALTVGTAWPSAHAE